jgi:hypothetical protein
VVRGATGHKLKISATPNYGQCKLKVRESATHFLLNAASLSFRCINLSNLEIMARAS